MDAALCNHSFHFPGLSGHCVQTSPSPRGLHSLYLNSSSASKLTPAQSNPFCPGGSWLSLAAGRRLGWCQF